MMVLQRVIEPLSSKDLYNASMFVQIQGTQAGA